MFAVRFLILLFLNALSWEFANTPIEKLNSTGLLIANSWFVLFPLLYMLPTYEAWRKKHPNLPAIALVNLFLGWTVLGWVGAIVWAFKRPEPVTVRGSAEGGAPTLRPARQTKSCAFCAEEILAAAIKCKHCGSDVRA